jgi:4-amino-4-deoxy-L-arabinose transferase-like glycosyltransferase
MSFDIDSWYYSAIGDEYAFFNFAKEIAIGKVKISILPLPNTVSVLDQNGVYGIVPIAVSVYQAFVMKIFGINHHGWIIASILSVIFSFFPFYFLIKLIFDAKTALLTLIIYASSHLLWAFTHLGYWNINGFFLFYSSLLFYLLAKKRKSWFFYFLSGVLSGLCFLTNYFARASFFIIGVMFILDIKKHKKNWKSILYYLIGFLFIFIPFLYVNQEKTFTAFLSRSLISTGEIPDRERVIYFFKNLTGSFFSFYNNKQVAHFVSGSLVDPVTAFFLTIGLIVTILNYKKYKIILISLALLLILVGGLNQHREVTATRVLFILPLIVAVAACGVKTSLAYLSEKNKALIVAYPIILGAIFVLNYNRFYYETPRKTQSTKEAVIIKAINERCYHKKVLVVFKYYTAVLQPAIESYQLLKDVSFITDPKFNETFIGKYDCYIFADTDSAKKKYINFDERDFTLSELTDFSQLTKVGLIRKN